MKYFKADF